MLRIGPIGNHWCDIPWYMTIMCALWIFCRLEDNFTWKLKFQKLRAPTNCENEMRIFFWLFGLVNWNFDILCRISISFMQYLQHFEKIIFLRVFSHFSTTGGGIQILWILKKMFWKEQLLCLVGFLYMTLLSAQAGYLLKPKFKHSYHNRHCVHQIGVIFTAKFEKITFFGGISPVDFVCIPELFIQSMIGIWS